MMMKSSLAAILVVALIAGAAQAHVRTLYADTPNWSIRNANGATGDGVFSVAGPCGGAGTYGANGVSTANAGATETLNINYGTGTNGDHASGANVFQAFFECGSPSEGTMGGSGNTISGTVAAPGGSQPGGFDVTLTIPAGATGDCTVSIKDQRNWGMCFDLDVQAAPCAAMAGVDAAGLPLGANFPETAVGQTATLNCPTDYTGTVSVTCQAGGTFSAPTGTCQAIPCTAQAVTDANGLAAGNIAQLEVGATQAVTCPTGYTGTVTASCALGNVVTTTGACVADNGQVGNIDGNGNPVDGSSTGFSNIMVGPLSLIVVLAIGGGLLAVCGCVACIACFGCGAAAGVSSKDDGFFGGSQGYGNNNNPHTGYSVEPQSAYGGPYSNGPQSGGPYSNGPQSAYGGGERY